MNIKDIVITDETTLEELKEIALDLISAYIEVEKENKELKDNISNLELDISALEDQLQDQESTIEMLEIQLQDYMDGNYD
jgi:hypothetical protein